MLVSIDVAWLRYPSRTAVPTPLPCHPMPVHAHAHTVRYCVTPRACQNGPHSIWCHAISYNTIPCIYHTMHIPCHAHSMPCTFHAMYILCHTHTMHMPCRSHSMSCTHHAIPTVRMPSDAIHTYATHTHAGKRKIGFTAVARATPA